MSSRKLVMRGDSGNKRGIGMNWLDRKIAENVRKDPAALRLYARLKRISVDQAIQDIDAMLATDLPAHTHAREPNTE